MDYLCYVLFKWIIRLNKVSTQLSRFWYFLNCTRGPLFLIWYAMYMGLSCRSERSAYALRAWAPKKKIVESHAGWKGG